MRFVTSDGHCDEHILVFGINSNSQVQSVEQGLVQMAPIKDKDADGMPGRIWLVDLTKRTARQSN